MSFIQGLLISLIPLGVAVYTFNFGRWLWGKGYHRGAAGVYALALASLVMPLGIWVYIQVSR